MTTDDPSPSVASTNRRVLKLRFMVSDDLTDNEVHDLGEQVIADLVTSADVTFDSTEVVDES